MCTIIILSNIMQYCVLFRDVPKINVHFFFFFKYFTEKNVHQLCKFDKF